MLLHDFPTRIILVKLQLGTQFNDHILLHEYKKITLNETTCKNTKVRHYVHQLMNTTDKRYSNFGKKLAFLNWLRQCFFYSGHFDLCHMIPHDSENFLKGFQLFLPKVRGINKNEWNKAVTVPNCSSLLNKINL